ncbi:hypothetical protein K501DRAFT_225748 [Backusella circina FSU 941]|nr:hypothetical protein K501DRAFT_225748 [Backusella circina FSU 941]
MDPIAPHSPGISGYMSVHEATNLAYVRYFGKIDEATKATFKSIDSQKFTVDYELSNGTKGQVSIPFEKPLRKREEIRPVLEAMAKEAETALGLPSSLAGPPPLKAIAKAVVASATDIYTPPQPSVPLNSFIAPDAKDMLAVGVLVGSTVLLAYSSDSYLARQFPSQVLQLRSKLGAGLFIKIFRGLVITHVAESLLATVVCVNRGWYSPFTTAKWAISTFFFGVGSFKKLRKHVKDVQGLKSD